MGNWVKYIIVENYGTVVKLYKQEILKPFCEVVTGLTTVTLTSICYIISADRSSAKTAYGTSQREKKVIE